MMSSDRRTAADELDSFLTPEDREAVDEFLAEARQEGDDFDVAAMLDRNLDEACAALAAGARMSEQPTVTTMATAYTVTAMDPDEPDGSSWWIEVSWLGPMKLGKPRPIDQQWTIMHLHGFFLARDGGWECPPARQDDGIDAWWSRHQFSLEEALDLAREAAPHVVVGGMTPAHAIEWRKQQRAKEPSR